MYFFSIPNFSLLGYIHYRWRFIVTVPIILILYIIYIVPIIPPSHPNPNPT
jgi:hypothetical protein